MDGATQYLQSELQNLSMMGPRPARGTFLETQASVDVTAAQPGPGLHGRVFEQL